MAEVMTVAEYHAKLKKPRKYRNEPVFSSGYFFDSRKEARRYSDLCLLRQAGKIGPIQVHPKYELRVGGVLIGTFTPDFEYQDLETKERVVEDVKAPVTMTTAYKLRKRLMLALYQIEVREV